MTGQLPPFDLEAEAGALACVLIANDTSAELLSQLMVDHFHDLRHRTIFSTCLSLEFGGRPVNPISLVQTLKDQGRIEDAGGLDYLIRLEDCAPSASNFETYLPTLQDRAARRQMLLDAEQAKRRALNLSISVVPKVDPLSWLTLAEDGAELQTRNAPALVEIAAGIVAEHSKLSIVSSAKCFKSWLSIYLAICIAHGLDFLGRSTTRRRVLYVNLELKPVTFTRRLQAIARALDVSIDAEWFTHLPLRGKLSGLSVREIITRLGGVAGRLNASVIIVDPLFKLNVEGEENSSRDQTVFCNELDRLTTEFNCTAIFNDHSGKGNQSEKDPLDVIRGSSAKGGDLDAAMVLRKHEVEGCFRVDMVHRELPPVPPFVIGWEFPLMRVRLDLDPDNVKRIQGGRAPTRDPEDLCASISDSSAENPISISAWALKADISRQTLQGYLPKLRASGLIMTAGEGNSARQYLTQKGREAARRGTL